MSKEILVNCLIAIGIGFLGKFAWNYYTLSEDIAQECLYGELSALAYDTSNKPAFCQCLGERMKSQIGFINSVTKANDQNYVGEILGVSAFQCGQVYQ